MGRGTARELRVDMGTVRRRLVTGQYVVITDANGPVLAMSRPTGLEKWDRVALALLDVTTDKRQAHPTLVWVILDRVGGEVAAAA